MLEIPLPRKVLGVLLGLLGVLAGCDSNSTRYPRELRYPPRKDVLIKKESAVQPDYLPSPGQLDEGIREAHIKLVDGKEVPRADGIEFVDPTKLTTEQSDALRKALAGLFGSPMQPRVEAAAAAEIGLDGGPLADGSELYRKHCMHCHGVAGDGRGPTAPWVHPHPRDYRAGKFKFVSNAPEYNGEAVELKPSRQDLYRIVHKGIDGTSMPAFSALPDREIDLLVGYVMHLSIRGEVESRTISDLLNPSGKTKGSADAVETFAKESAEKVTADWALMNNPAVQVKPKEAYPAKYSGVDKDKEMAASIERGYKLFTAKGDGGCISCHSDFGRQAKYRYDTWGTLVQPRNLTTTTYRGGRRPIDFYWRVKIGIPPSGMPKQALTDEATWDVVHFVQALPYPLMLPNREPLKVRDKVYGPYMQEPKKHDDGHEKHAASR
ncbi:MAG: c-type cytochrome [Gemmataceae bacterium]